jgi:prophage antirepressor-like protein
VKNETLTPPAEQTAETQTFTFMEVPVRGLYLEGKPWFVGRDIADVLEYKNSSNALKHHCKGVEKFYPLATPGGVQEVRIISEPDVYRLVSNSTMPKAQEFEAWIYETVIPQIRETGGYQTGRKLKGGAAAWLVDGYAAALEADYLAAELKAARREIKRYENRNFLSCEDRREIITLSVAQYPISAIQRITKKGRTRIEKYLDEFLALDDAAMEKELVNLGFRNSAAGKGKGGAE